MRSVPIALFAVSLGAAACASAGDVARGRALYETRCVDCHAASVHSRSKRIAASCLDVRAQVARWSRHQGGDWTADEIDDVTLYLNERYYRFPVRDGPCVTTLARTG